MTPGVAWETVKACVEGIYVNPRPVIPDKTMDLTVEGASRPKTTDTMAEESVNTPSTILVTFSQSGR
jgi:hypothetical protein